MLGLKNISKIIFEHIFLALIIAGIAAGCSVKNDVPAQVLISNTCHTVKKGEFLEDILNRDLPVATTNAVLKIMDDAGFEFRYCMPGDSVEIMLEDDRFSRIIYRKSITQEYCVNDVDGCLYVSMKLPYIDTIPWFLCGDVQSTLYESIIALGETPNLVYRFVDVFAWEIDFVTETQKNDSFFVLLEKTYCDSQFISYQNIIATYYKGDIGEYYGIYYKDEKGHEDYYNLKGESLRKALLKSPLRYSYISSYFTERRFHPILKVWRPHHGLDYSAPIGTPVSSIGSGTVTYKGWRGGYGNLVEIKHKNNFKTRYGHLSKFAKGLYQGKKVKMGELIGYVGSTGLSTGPHLHFELHKNGVPINPLKVNIPRAPSVAEEYMVDFQQHCDSILQYIESLRHQEPDEKIITYIPDTSSSGCNC
jgi:murein DD-endopeptidase MepM/ murein hydrolase activator NlpD